MRSEAGLTSKAVALESVEPIALAFKTLGSLVLGEGEDGVMAAKAEAAA